MITIKDKKTEQKAHKMKRQFARLLNHTANNRKKWLTNKTSATFLFAATATMYIYEKRPYKIS